MLRGRSFIILGGAALPWIYPMGVELASFGPTVVVHVGASLFRPGAGPSWPFEDHPARFERVMWSYPPGYNGKLARWFTPTIRRRLGRLVRSMRETCEATPYVVVPDPRYAPYVADIPEAKLVYRNYDDFSIYSPRDGCHDNPREIQLVRSAGTIACSSIFQRRAFERRFPAKSDSIFHLPHGVHEAFLNPAYSVPERTSVCAVGSLTVRYDWRLVDEVVKSLPDVEFVFAGEIVSGAMGAADSNWRQRMLGVLARPNVRHVKGLRHRDTAPIYWSSSLSWMPYSRQLPFVEASSPLKLSDGLASGRPLISADIPEARLYPEWVGIFETAEQARQLISESLSRGSHDSQDRFRAQVDFAAGITWAARAKRLVDLLERASVNAD